MVAIVGIWAGRVLAIDFFILNVFHGCCVALRCLRRFLLLPFGRPPSLPFSRAVFALAGLLREPRIDIAAEMVSFSFTISTINPSVRGSSMNFKLFSDCEKPSPPPFSGQ